jgi:stage III sporulation protein AH
MKKLFRRNQMVLTVLAVLVAIAGYITLTGNDPTVASLKEGDEPTATIEADNNLNEQVAAENSANELAQNNGENQDELPEKVDTGALDETVQDVISNPGEAVLTSGITVADFMANARLSREQVRASNKETLLEIINSEALGDDQKEEAINSMLTLTQNAEKENATETLLHAKGFDDAMVNIVDGRVNVVIAATSITDAEKAQIEDIVKQKTEMSVDQIVISLMELQE